MCSMDVSLTKDQNSYAQNELTNKEGSIHQEGVDCGFINESNDVLLPTIKLGTLALSRNDSRFIRRSIKSLLSCSFGFSRSIAGIQNLVNRRYNRSFPNDKAA